MKLRRVAAMTLLAATVAWPAYAAGRGSLLYPLQSEPALSSNFGQYRFGHPHGGLDCWSYLKLGGPVAAVEAGRVVQIQDSTGPGYGRAIYQRLADGRTAVYAHLSAFSPKIRKALAAAGRPSRGRRFALAETAPVAIERGEVIGFVGDAGTDVAHLHFELRDPDNRPVNPLRAGLFVPDDRPPVLEALRFEPMAADAHAAGRSTDATQRFERGADGVYRAAPIKLHGKVGLSAYVYDLSDNSPRRLAPYELRLLIDGREVFVHRFEHMAYERGYEGDLSYERPLIVAQQQPFIRLYRLYDRTSFHAAAGDGDLSALAAGAHRAELLAMDEAGNQARGEFELQIEPWPAAATPEAAEAGRGKAPSPATAVLDPQLEWRRGFALITGQGGLLDGKAPRVAIAVAAAKGKRAGGGETIAAGECRLNLADGEFALSVPVPRLRAGELRVTLTWDEAPGGRVAQTLAFPFQTAANGGSVVSPDGQARLQIPADALFRPAPMTVEAVELPVPEGLEAVGPAYRFGAADEPLRKRLRIAFHAPRRAHIDRAGVYLYDRGTWWRLDSSLSAMTTGFGTYALLRDVEPPVLGALYVGATVDAGAPPVEPPTGSTPARAAPAAEARLPALVVVAWDRGSGVAPSSIVATIDGVRQPVRHVALKDQVVIQPTAPLAPGQHELVVTLRDQAGNRGEKKETFTVR